MNSKTIFLYDGDELVAEYSSSGSLLRRYVHGLGNDDPLVWYEGTGTGNSRYLLADEKGSIITETSSSGSVLAQHSYGPYGEPQNSSSSRFRYTGQILIPGTELYYYKARVYHPKLGRFMQTDPIGYEDGMNWYAYVGNDPINGVDPDGESSLLVTRISPVARAVRTGIRTQAARTPKERMQQAIRRIEQQTNDTVKNSKEVIEQQPVKPSAPVGDDSVPGLLGRAIDAIKELSDMGVFSDASIGIDNDRDGVDSENAGTDSISEPNPSLEEVFPDFDEFRMIEVPEA